MYRSPWDMEEIVREVLTALARQKPPGGAGPDEHGRPGAIPVGCPPDRPAALSANEPKSERGSSSGGAEAAVSGVGATSSPNSGISGPSEDGQVRIASRLVTMAELRACGVPENLAGVRRVVVRPDALITPLVLDELQRRNIPLVRELGPGEVDGATAAAATVTSATGGQGSVADRSARSEPATGTSSGSPGLAGETLSVQKFLLVVHGKAYEPAGLASRLTAEQVPLDVRQTECIVRATDQLAEVVQTGHCQGVLLTGNPAIGLCAANRHPGVRAVWGLEPAQAASDARSLGANLLIINPRTVSPYQLEKMIREFYRAGLRPCPEALKSRLG